MSQRPIPLDFQPGIQRDGTALDAQRALDSLWTRWRLGRPRKMGGYTQAYGALNGTPRRIHMYYKGSKTYIHIGTANGIQQVVLDQFGNFLSAVDRTPVIEFIGGPTTGYTFDALFDDTSNYVTFVAHASPDLTSLATNTKTTPFIGQIDGTARLVPLSEPSGLVSPTIYNAPLISGGIVCVQPFLFDFDSDGFVGWSAPNLPNYLGASQGSSGAGQARISGQKVVAGYPLRGGGAQQPAVLFFTLSEVISGVYVGPPAYFSLSTVSPDSSILSSDCVIEYDGLYFWVGIDRFLVFNGTVNEVPNQQNQDWFFDNLNRAYAAKCFAFKVPRFGEIWFCAPLFGATEPSHACIYNVRENTWYDTVLPDGGRSCGFYAQGFQFPAMGGVQMGPNGYPLWLHENGVDRVDSTGASAVRAYYETPWAGGPKSNPPDDAGMSVQQLEPDFIQSGDMFVQLIGTSNSRAPVQTTGPQPLEVNPAVPQEQLVSFPVSKASNRLSRLHIESNVVGGNFISGRNLLHVDKGDSRIVS